MYSLGVFLLCGGRGLTGGVTDAVSLCTRDTDRSPLSLTARGALCLHTELHVPAVTDDRGCLADITAARHSHRLPSDAPGTSFHRCAPPATRIGNDNNRTSKDVHSALESRAVDVFRL